MRAVVLLLSLVLGVASTRAELVTVPPGVTTDITKLHNGCLIAALEMQAALLAQKDLSKITWAKIVRTYGYREGHAWCVYALRNGDLWAYDIINGSTDLETTDHDIDAIVAALRASRPRMDIRGGEFIG